MSVYAVALIAVTDKDAMVRYREHAAAALARHGGKVAAADPAPTVLEAAETAPSVVAVLEFPTIEAAKAWRADPEIAEVHGLRNAGGKSTIVLLPALG